MNLTFNQSLTLAQSPTATVEQLTKLANDENSDVRRCVAQHPNCPIPALEKLANDKEWRVRSYVARHPNCPISSLEKLANDEDSDVRSNVAEHPNCPQYLKDFIKVKNFITNARKNTAYYKLY
jgi:hypothetical protein